MSEITPEWLLLQFKTHLNVLWTNGYLRGATYHILEGLYIDDYFVKNVHRELPKEKETKETEETEETKDPNLVIFNIDFNVYGKTYRTTIETSSTTVASFEQINSIEFTNCIHIHEYAPPGGYKKGECKENTIPFCRYCKRHGHMIKMEPRGRIICPRLASTLCEKCGQYGHTTNKCKSFPSTQHVPTTGTETETKTTDTTTDTTVGDTTVGDTTVGDTTVSDMGTLPTTVIESPESSVAETEHTSIDSSVSRSYCDVVTTST